MKKVSSGITYTNAERPTLPPTASVKTWNWSMFALLGWKEMYEMPRGVAPCVCADILTEL